MRATDQYRGGQNGFEWEGRHIEKWGELLTTPVITPRDHPSYGFKDLKGIKGAGTVAFAVLIMAVGLGVQWLLQHPRYHAIRAREAVQQDYASEKANAENDNYPFRYLREQYGRVIDFQIVRERPAFSRYRYNFEVQVMREHGKQLEIAQAFSTTLDGQDRTSVANVTVDPSSR